MRGTACIEHLVGTRAPLRCLGLTSVVVPVLMKASHAIPPLCHPRALLQEEESLAHEIKCFENTPQASQVKLVAQKASPLRFCILQYHRPLVPAPR